MTVYADGTEVDTSALQSEMERLRAENAALKSQVSSPLKIKVSQKGAVSVYGLGRFPVTLYKSQWDRLLDSADDVRNFMAMNEDKLAVKN